MTKAQERQAGLDAQIEAFLANGGEIKAFDNLRRPVESGPWRSKSIHPAQQAPVEVPPIKAKPAAKAQAKPAPAPAPSVEVAAPPPEVLLQEPAQVEPVKAEQSDERLAVKIIIEAALGGSPRVIARNLQIPLPRCRAIARQYHVQFRA
ncbi:hypothetical protein HBN76_04295 [Pseudomonas sp. WS 5013]|uniref:hypothetical protein n=1 Tax=Pseudomonas sp. WS 5013 TaxID=2717475 RepID=UPI001473F7E3|nr:hypothetical protein [Pseudomonas sp. WS 5013]NMY40517.1 hypothetical protein [Pseudomonas sp. WS 5013]